MVWSSAKEQCAEHYFLQRHRLADEVGVIGAVGADFGVQFIGVVNLRRRLTVGKDRQC